ncbi:MAG: hypothetical protein IPK99_10130 [Flavobacteriales bacterium]|nr:hypothetical protein [Flavobacteriales bacterium]
MSTARNLFVDAGRSFFIGNYFYGVCAVALSVEASLQQRFPLNHGLYYAGLFLCTVVFYTHAYRAHGAVDSVDIRVRWYARNHRLVGVTWILWSVSILWIAWTLLRTMPGALRSLSPGSAAVAALFPIAGLAYYGSGAVGLRRVGWLKPFVIAFVWAGVVTIYPVFFHQIERGEAYAFISIGLLLFLKNFMFFAMLAVLFDIKDHATDHRNALYTFIVQRGLRSTIFRLVLPLSALGLGTFVIYGTAHGFSVMRILLNTLPFALLFAVAYSLRRRRSIMYYLVVVDGLMLVKAICGSIAMRFF